VEKGLGFGLGKEIDGWEGVGLVQVSGARKRRKLTCGSHSSGRERGEGRVPFRYGANWAAGRIGAWAESFPSAFSLFLFPFLFF
jgi:hypothetical protein